MVDEDFAWRLAQELVRIDSSDPGAYEDEIERYIKALVEAQLERLSHPVLYAVQVEELEVLPGRRNLKVTVPGQSDEPRLVYICHMDTVTLGDGWDADIAPLGAVVRDDKLYGRGACDMKGGLACAIAALVHTLERVAADGALPRRGFSLICSVDEEDFMRGSEAAINAGWVGSREWMLDTEPTDGQIQVAHKGRTWFEIEMAGVRRMSTQTLAWSGTTVGFFTGYTDTAVIAGKTGNRNCMSYGPGSLALAHKPDEYVPHADIVRCQNVLIALADNTLWDASGQVGA